MRVLLLATAIGLLPVFSDGSPLDTSSPAALFDLTESALIQNEQGRKILRYAIECALPDGTHATARHDGTDYLFHGSLGLAPNWRGAAINEDEQEAVSACLFARTNAMGVPIMLSMRTQSPSLGHVAELQESASEAGRYLLFEGRFWGNIFLENPLVFTCRADASPEAAAELQKANRLCTLPLAERDARGRQISACGFVVTGPCSAGGSIETEGKRYDFIIDVYLSHEDRP